MAEIELAAQRKRQYKDVSLSFGRNPVSNDVIAVTGEEAVKRAIKTILLTQAGEVPFFPEFGSRLTRLLFEPIDPITTSLIEDEIRTTIATFEPRCKIQSLVVTPTDDAHQYQIDITFQLINVPEPVTLTLFLTRER